MNRSSSLRRIAAGLASSLTVLVAVTAPTTAQAIIQPTGVSTSLVEMFGFRAGNLIDQSGLPPYVDGVTDFASYVASTVHPNSNQASLLANSNGRNQPNGVVNPGETITFDLGRVRDVDAAAIWGQRVASEAVTGFRIHADTDANFGNGVSALLGSYTRTASQQGRSFPFPVTATRFLHIEITQHGGGSFLRLGEVAFRSAEVHVTFTPDDEIAPGQTVSVNFHASRHANESMLPILSCSAGRTPIPGSSLSLPLLIDGCTSFFLSDPAADALFSFDPPGNVFGRLDGNGQASGTMSLPAGFPSGLGLPLHFCFVTFNTPNQFTAVSSVGTLLLN